MALTETEREIVDATLEREGGWKYTDDPADPGGQTYGGCTRATLNNWRVGKGNAPLSPVDFLRHAETGNEDLKRDVRQCYVDRFVRPFEWIESLPLRRAVVDCAVNCGMTTAIRALQTVVGTDRDGIVGPRTKRATTAAANRRLIYTLLEYTKVRCEHYAEIVQRRPSQSKWLKGWLLRAQDVGYEQVCEITG